MCKTCRATKTARTAMRNRAILQLKMDDLADQGIDPGPMMRAEAQMLRDQRLAAENVLFDAGLCLNPLGELCYITAL